jgi:glycerate kinase
MNAPHARSDAAAFGFDPSSGGRNPQPLLEGASWHAGAMPPPAPADTADRSITVLIAASAAQQTLGARQVEAAVEEGVHAAMPSARVLRLPGVGASAGFVDEIVDLSGGAIARVGMQSWHGEGSIGRLGLLGSPSEPTAVIAIDEATDMRRLPPDQRDPTRASSRHAGQLILAALDRGARRIIIGCGESGANDGGIGMANALGIRFLDASRTEIAEAGGLLRLAAIDMSRRDRRLDEVTIEAVVNPDNELLGERGVTRIHGPRNGLSETQIFRLERGLTRYAEVVRASLGIDVTQLPGSGASGGLAAGLVAFAGARLQSRLDFLENWPGLHEVFGATDLVITVDDRLLLEEPARRDRVRQAEDARWFDRVPAWVAGQAHAKGLPVISLTGEIFFSGDVTAPGDGGPLPVVRAAIAGGEHAARHASALLRDASAAALRRVMSGWNRPAQQT